jgi:hypothetical protein
MSHFIIGGKMSPLAVGGTNVSFLVIGGTNVNHMQVALMSGETVGQKLRHHNFWCLESYIYWSLC